MCTHTQEIKDIRLNMNRRKAGCILNTRATCFNSTNNGVYEGGMRSAIYDSINIIRELQSGNKEIISTRNIYFFPSVGKLHTENWMTGMTGHEDCCDFPLGFLRSIFDSLSTNELCLSSIKLNIVENHPYLSPNPDNIC